MQKYMYNTNLKIMKIEFEKWVTRRKGRFEFTYRIERSIKTHLDFGLMLEKQPAHYDNPKSWVLYLSLIWLRFEFAIFEAEKSHI